MVIGRGFVASGGGFVSTPATRAAALAAGTYGATGYVGAQQTAARLSSALSGGVIAEKAAAAQAASNRLRERVVAAKRVGLSLAEYEARQKCGVKPTTPPRYFADHNITPTPGHDWICRVDGWIWTMDAAEKVQVERAERESDIAPYTPTPKYIPKTPTTPTAPTITAECPKGLFYDAKWYLQCTKGYIEYSLKGHNKCICSAKMAEAKAQLDSLYIKEEGNDEENGDGERFFGIDLGKITDFAPLIVGGVIVVALLGLFKK